MYQQAHAPNSAQIGRINNSTVTIIQENNVANNTPHFVQLEPDSASVQRYSRGEIKKRALRGSIVIAIPFITTSVGYFADWLEILNSLGWGMFFTVYVALISGLGLAMLTAIVEHRNVTALGYWISKPMRRNIGKLIRLGEFLEVDDDGNM
jgi:hypothetical protein